MLSGWNGECDETRSILKPSRSISNHFFFHLTSYLPKNSHEQVIQKMVYASKNIRYWWLEKNVCHHYYRYYYCCSLCYLLIPAQMRKINPNACFAIGISYFFQCSEALWKSPGKEVQIKMVKQPPETFRRDRCGRCTRWRHVTSRS